jgi:hypothetical protein
VVEGYGNGGALLAQRRVGSALFEEVLETVLGKEGVAYAHIRNAEAGCFIARVDREDDQVDAKTTNPAETRQEKIRQVAAGTDLKRVRFAALGLLFQRFDRWGDPLRRPSTPS